jgi:hypothetical protein
MQVTDRLWPKPESRFPQAFLPSRCLGWEFDGPAVRNAGGDSTTLRGSYLTQF